MELSFNPNYFKNKFNSEKRSGAECVELCAKAGYKTIDYTPDILSDDWEDEISKVINVCEKYGIVIDQSHAPFNRYGSMSVEEFSDIYERSVEASRIMGIKTLVFHADEYRVPQGGKYDFETAVRESCRVIEPHINRLSSLGIKAAFENLFEDGYKTPPGERSRCCSTAEELLSAIEYFDSSSVGCCWDFGHAVVAFGKDNMTSEMKKLGKHIIATHVHDNQYEKDLHMLPFYGKTDWELQMNTLRDFGYKGNLTFEMVYGVFPDEVIPSFLEQSIKIGNCLLQMFNK